MRYDSFKMMVNGFIERAGAKIKVRFLEDTDSGKYIAACSDGTTFIGNRTSIKLTVIWGSGHQAII